MNKEPLWWAEARKLRASGMSWSAIGRRVGKDHSTVIYAVDPARRERERQRMSKYNERRPRQRNEDRSRQKVLRIAAYEAAETGKSVDEVLRAWGEPARREVTR